MRNTPIGEHVGLTAAQRRELEKIAGAPGGHSEGKGAEWSVRVRLRAIGLLELRRIFEFRLGKHVNQHDKNMWFVTEAGEAVLRLKGAGSAHDRCLENSNDGLDRSYRLVTLTPDVVGR